jgi:sec-independent protein translocase protein TatA
MNLGALELSIILIIILVFFGAKKIPELFKGIGKGMKEFRKVKNDIDED